MNTPFKKRESPLSLNSEDTSENSKEKSQPKKKVDQVVKVKYTAVMEKKLRTRLKVASAEKNLQISEFIEEAVLEKLQREGY